uniref:Uncharacterized protein n=1 Tax=Oryza sativa subsp. japonica TaxID=39947 RepID=Q2R8K2_ORYSJ|nr:hypothetical protein LOC_Os11g11900 [Oryza sativa Japonica Group]
MRLGSWEPAESLSSLKKLLLINLHKDFKVQWNGNGMHQKMLHVAEPRILIMMTDGTMSQAEFPCDMSVNLRRPVAWPSSPPSADRLPSRTGGKGCTGDSQIWPCRSRFGGFRTSWGKRPVAEAANGGGSKGEGRIWLPLGPNLACPSRG